MTTKSKQSKAAKKARKTQKSQTLQRKKRGKIWIPHTETPESVAELETADETIYDQMLRRSAGD